MRSSFRKESKRSIPGVITTSRSALLPCGGENERHANSPFERIEIDRSRADGAARASCTPMDGAPSPDASPCMRDPSLLIHQRVRRGPRPIPRRRSTPGHSSTHTSRPFLLGSRCIGLASAPFSNGSTPFHQRVGDHPRPLARDPPTARHPSETPRDPSPTPPHPSTNTSAPIPAHIAYLR